MSMMKQWTLFPTVLQRKFLLTLLAGIASAGISVIICVATKDHILLALGIVVLCACLISCRGIWATAAHKNYEVVEGGFPMYKPHTIEQYKVYRFLEENFALEHFLLAPLSRFGLMLEDKTGEKIAFAFLNDCVQEIPVPAPAAPETVIAFLKQFRSLTPRPVVHDFEALTRWWLDNPNPLTYQQALGMSDNLYHHFLSHPLISEDDALRLARKGLVTESEYNDLQLWYFNGHTMSCWFGPLGVDGTGSLYGLTFDYQTASPTKTQFYLLDDYYRVMNHLTE